MIIGRRGFIAGIAALIAAPAIVRPESLMAIAPVEKIIVPNNSLLTIAQITRASVEMFAESNAFIRNLNAQYENEFGREGATIGTTLRIRLPSDYFVPDVSPISLAQPVMPEISSTEMATIGAAAVLVKNPVMSRRFWQ